MEAREGLELVQCSGLLERLGVELDRCGSGVDPGVPAMAFLVGARTVVPLRAGESVAWRLGRE